MNDQKPVPSDLRPTNLSPLLVCEKCGDPHPINPGLPVEHGHLAATPTQHTYLTSVSYDSWRTYYHAYVCAECGATRMYGNTNSSQRGLRL